MLLRVSDEWSRWLERRAGGKKEGRGKRWMVAVGEWLRGFESSFGYLCLPGGLPLSPLSLFLSFIPFLPPSSLSCSTPLFSLPQFYFNTFFSITSMPSSWPLTFTLPPHLPPPLFTTLFKYLINWLMSSAAQNKQPGVLCISVGRVFSQWDTIGLWTNVFIWLMSLLMHPRNLYLGHVFSSSWVVRADQNTAF